MPLASERTNVPGVYRRSPTSFYVTWREGGKLRKEYHPTLAKAKKAKQAKAGGYERRVYSAETFEKYATRWLDTYRGVHGDGLAESTQKQWRRSIEKAAVPFFRRRKLRDIDGGNISEFIAWMEKPKSEGGLGATRGAVAKNLVPLKALFSTAKREGKIPHIPTEGFRMKQSKSKSRAFTDEELRLFFMALPDEWRTFYAFLAETGLRISEALGLIWEDLDLSLDAPVVKVRFQLAGDGRRRIALKTDNSLRDVPLTRSTTDALLRLRAKRRGGDDAPVFQNTMGGFLSAHNLRNRVHNPTLKSIGLEGQRMGFHAFRHTAATMLYEAPGQEVKDVQLWLGHSSARFTADNYIHRRNENRAGADYLEEKRAVWATS